MSANARKVVRNTTSLPFPNQSNEHSVWLWAQSDTQMEIESVAGASKTSTTERDGVSLALNTLGIKPPKLHYIDATNTNQTYALAR
jgi:hypothetical protein